MVTRAVSGAVSGRRVAREALIEVAVGLAVIVAIIAVLALAVSGRLAAASAGYDLRASFARIDGLSIGSDVRIAGVSVGRVTAETVDSKRFVATVTFRLRRDIRLPVDSSAAITSESLLGGKYLAISPGGDPSSLAPDGLITATAGSISLEALLTKFIGSVTGLMDAVKASGVTHPATGHAPAAGLGP